MTVACETGVEDLRNAVETLRRAKREQHVFADWFLVQELRMEARERLRAAGADPDTPAGQARILCGIAERMPLSFPPGAVLAGSQDGAFSPSYALIRPDFRVESFEGYCDPTAIYNEMPPLPEQGITAERIARVRAYWEAAPHVRALAAVQDAHRDATREALYFMEPVTGHLVPDLRPVLREGVRARQAAARALGTCGEAMAGALEAACILADRYRALALETAAAAAPPVAARLRGMAAALERVPAGPARTLREALQAYCLLWQTMVLEQAPNPYAFSTGNLDRVFDPYHDPDRDDAAAAVELLRHFLCFFQVGDRCWAISQNLLVGGRDAEGKDATVPMTELLLEAFFASNDPQPALSVRVHRETPDAIWEGLGRFFFTPGHSTPSLFSDDSLLPMLHGLGVAPADAAEVGIAGCQEPLVMGKSNLNTTNTWLNLAKVLELALNDGRSLLSGARMGPDWATLGMADGDAAWADPEAAFFAVLDRTLPRMAAAGNACTDALGRLRPAPLTSALMDSFSTGRDVRDPARPGCRYHAAGCLVHGLSVVADSLVALRRALASGLWTAEGIRAALRDDCAGADDLRTFLRAQPKWGNGEAEADETAARLVREVSRRIEALRTSAGTPFRPDWSTPSTHLLYGYHVGATPDGRPARAMLGYGVDPRPDALRADLPERIAAAWRLPYHAMTGGYASHVGLAPGDATGRTLAEKGRWLRDRVVAPLFRFGTGAAAAPYYVYLNIDSPDHLKAVLADPATHAPSGVYILRIHGTFVNFLDLSPAIQQDIIARLAMGPGPAAGGEGATP